MVRLICGGICNTDIELRRGYYGFRGIPGHEFVGEVVEGRLKGKRVVGEINLPCRKCEWCRRGMGRHCPKRKVLGIVKHPGAFREYIDLPEENLHVVPDSVATEDAVFTEPLAAACEILEQVTIPRGERVAVLGRGKLGRLIAQVLEIHGAEVDAFGRPETPRSIMAAYDYVIEASGAPEGLAEAVRMVRPRGTIVMKSTVYGAVPIDTAPIIVNEITLVGSRCGRFEAALALLESGRLRPSAMIIARYPLRDAPEAFDRAMQPGALKVLLDA